MNENKPKITMAIVFLLLAAAMIIVMSSRLTINKFSKKNDADRTALPSSSAYPEMTYGADDSVKISSPTFDASADREDNSGAEIQYGSATAFVENASPKQAVIDYLSKSGVVSVTDDGVWDDHDCSSHTDISDKFQNLHTIQTFGVYQSDITYGDAKFYKGHQGSVIAYVTYDGTTSTIHSLFVDSISFIADGYVDGGMAGYMFD